MPCCAHLLQERIRSWSMEPPKRDTPTKTTRQEDKLKAKLAKDLWFVVKWTEEEDELFDVLGAKDLSITRKDVCEIAEGDVGEGKFGKGWYPVRILAQGSYSMMLKAREKMEEGVDSGNEAISKTPTKEAMLDTTMEVDHSSSDDWSSSEMKMGVGSAISKKGAKRFTSTPKRKYSTSKTKVATETPKKKGATLPVDKDTMKVDQGKGLSDVADVGETTPNRKRCLITKGKGTPKSKKMKDSKVQDEAKDAKKAALAKASAKSRGKELENVESSMRIFSQLDSTASSHREMTGRAYDDDRSYESPSWPPSLYSSSSATMYPNSSSSGNSDAATPFSASSPSGSMSTSFSPGFSQYLQEQRRTPFMPVPPRLFSSYTYPPAVHCGMQQDVPSIGQLTSCLYELMGEVKTIKNDLKRVKKRKDHQEGSDSSRFSPSPSPAPPSSNSCILGDPGGEHVKIDEFNQRQVKGKEVLSSNASSLALKLMDLFFSKEEMARSNCTPADGREILRQDIIAGIRCHVNYVYPADNSATRWKEILHKKMNSKCRNQRALFKKEE